MKSRLLRVITLLALSLSIFTACDSNNGGEVLPAEDGFFIVNEGTFNGGNASLSHYNRATNEVTNYVFENANDGLELGDQAQSMTVVGNRGYIVVQNSSKIEVINSETFELVTTINEGLPSPRYFMAVSDEKAYVTDWGADGTTGTVKVIDLVENTVINSIETDDGPNEMTFANGKVYVGHNGGWGYSSTISVIDPETDAISSIEVGDNPSQIVTDANDNVWVTSGGYTAYEYDNEGNYLGIDSANSRPGYLARIEGEQVAEKINAEVIGTGPGHLAVSTDGNTLYVGYKSAVYRMETSSTSFPEEAFINKSFYGLGVDPTNGNILGGEALNVTSAGTLYRYSATGELIEEYTTGVAPNGFAF
jgi:DNA-binding beta-propeller fold protein YncE